MKINTLILLLSTFFLYINSDISAQWINIESPVDVLLRDVFFTDTLHGWAIGDSSIIINTNDGGYNWNIQNSPIENLRFNRVQFIDKNVGYISAEKGVILSTKDGGITWFTTIIDTMIDYKGLSFINADTGWIAGTGNWGNYEWGYSGQILRTTDGGVTWEKQYGSDTLVTYPIEDDWFTDIKFIDSQVGYAVAGGHGTEIFGTANGGESWTRIGNLGNSLRNIDFIGDTIWAGGDIFASTVDNGLSWVFHAVLGGNVRDMTMINGSKGYILTNIGGFDQRIMYTENRGESFTDIWKYEGNVLIAMYIDTENNFICAVGALGRITINNNFITDIQNNDLVKTREFNLHQNYPNPFNPTTTIKYQIAKMEPHNRVTVHLNVYDILGRKVKTLVNNKQSAGDYTVDFDATGLPSAIYYYQLIVGDPSTSSRQNYTQTKKMVLIK